MSNDTASGSSSASQPIIKGARASSPSSKKVSDYTEDVRGCLATSGTHANQSCSKEILVICLMVKPAVPTKEGGFLGK